MASFETRPAIRMDGRRSGGVEPCRTHPHHCRVCANGVVSCRTYASGARRLAYRKTPYYPTPAYLVAEGPYRFSRNPIYVAEGMIWVGWIIFFGSLVILAVLATLAVVVGPLVLRREEKGLEARFGDAWVRCSKTTPRWFSIRSLRGNRQSG